MRAHTHLSDDRLVEVCFDDVVTAVEEAHFAACEACRQRRARLERMLRDVSDAGAAETDDVFTPEKLVAQHARILHRIEQDGRPARVISFPAASATELRPLPARPAGRWIAGAAAAGLAIGVLTGYLSHDLSTFGRPARSPMARAANALAPTQHTVRAVNASRNDEEFLGELESALDGPQLAVLRPLNDLTPR